MPAFNKVMLMGHLTRDPQTKTLPSNTSLTEFGLAVNRRYKTAAGEEREEVTFVDCAAFGRTGEVIAQYCVKGKAIFIEGRLKFDQWEDKQGGGKRSKLSVVVENFQFVGGREGEGDDAGKTREHRPRRQPRTNEPSASDRGYTDPKELTEEDIPF